MKKYASRSRMQGLSLIEVMISLVIGLVVVGAVMVTYLGSGKSGQQQAAYSEMNENAQIALGIMSRDLLLAGYAKPTGYDSGTGKLTRTYSGRAIFGCDTDFASPNTTGVATCSAAGKPSIEVTYEADLKNTVPTSANIPSDCLGNTLADAGGYFIAYNRYYLKTTASGNRSELYCASRQGSGGQPLVDNVDAMKIWYGVSAATDPRTIVRYVTAGNVSDWGLVVSVRLCLLMRSSETVLQGGGEDTPTYLDCNSTTQTSTDRYLRRAYFTTTTLRNKMTF